MCNGVTLRGGCKGLLYLSAFSNVEVGWDRDRQAGGDEGFLPSSDAAHYAGL
ncbi:MAG: hypothetical protein PHR77_10290 [Kiritimatiellae bacterium]|nr:hypothetical protein [Kiritimatiellia bacterium]MDD5519534.1 hypothetical protein [Kiritimatiellia bacterium]